VEGGGGGRRRRSSLLITRTSHRGTHMLCRGTSGRAALAGRPAVRSLSSSPHTSSSSTSSTATTSSASHLPFFIARYNLFTRQDACRGDAARTPHRSPLRRPRPAPQPPLLLVRPQPRGERTHGGRAQFASSELCTCALSLAPVRNRRCTE